MSSSGPLHRQDAVDPHRDLAGALHDVSNALTVLLGWVAEARGEGASPEVVSQALRVVEQQARHARDLARRAVGAGTATGTEGIAGPAAAPPVPLEEVMEEVLGGLALELRSHGVSVERGGGGAKVSARSTEDLRHILTNLVLNALAHGPRGSRLFVRVEEGEEGLRIEVEDEGPGVPEGQADLVFEGYSTRPGGAGVGLRHARSLARRAGGDLVLGPGERGARFQLSWPREERPPRPSAKSVRGGLELLGKRLLVVEDDDAVTDLLEAALEARGAMIVRVRTRSELELAVADPHDGALVDLSPIADDVAGAFAALRRAARPGAPVVVTTGSVDALAPGLATAIRVVRKPFELGEVVAALVASPDET